MAKKIHHDKPERGVVVGAPFDKAIRKILMPNTNKGNLNKTDWVRYCIAKEIALRNNGEIPKDCKEMIKDVFLSVCDNCDTVSVAPEYTPCINCGRIMAHVKFVREAAQQSVQADGALCEDCGKNPVLEGCSVCAECGL